MFVAVITAQATASSPLGYALGRLVKMLRTKYWILNICLYLETSMMNFYQTFLDHSFGFVCQIFDPFCPKVFLMKFITYRSRAFNFAPLPSHTHRPPTPRWSWSCPVQWTCVQVCFNICVHMPDGLTRSLLSWLQTKKAAIVHDHSPITILNSTVCSPSLFLFCKQDICPEH